MADREIPVQTDAELYQARILAWAVLDQQRSLVHAPERSAAQVIPRPASLLLSSCTSFRTLEQHASRFAQTRQVPEEDRPRLLRSLEELARIGLLISKTDLLRRAVAPPTAGPELSSIAILTRNRPAGLERCLRSYLDNVRAAGRAADFTVIDSSPDPDVRARNRDLLRALSAESRGALAYADTADKEAYAQRLAQEVDLAPDLVRFALLDVAGLGYDTGANRNAVLLAHPGRPFLSVDDDMVCDLRPVSSASDGLAMVASDPTVLRLFPDLAEALQFLPPTEVSVLACHERLLGKSVAVCLEGLSPDAISLDSLSPTMMESLLAGQARVSATFGGLLGDGGSDRPSFHLFGGAPLPAEQVALEDPGAFETLAASRQILRAAPRLTVASGTFTMAGTFALDARELSPPFFPVHRGEDLLFGAMFRRCWDDRFFGYLPWTTTHLPLEERRREGELLWKTTTRPALHSLLMNLFSLISCEAARSGPARLVLFGRQLRELAARPWADSGTPRPPLELPPGRAPAGPPGGAHPQRPLPLGVGSPGPPVPRRPHRGAHRYDLVPATDLRRPPRRSRPAVPPAPHQHLR